MAFVVPISFNLRRSAVFIVKSISMNYGSVGATYCIYYSGGKTLQFPRENNFINLRQICMLKQER